MDCSIGFGLQYNCMCFSGGTEVIADSDFHNSSAVLESGSVGRLSREKMVYMAVKGSGQEDEDISKSRGWNCRPPIEERIIWSLLNKLANNVR